MPNDSSLQSTKQMLDELDALMERMLSLPVNEVEDAPPIPREVVKAQSLPPALTATLTLLQTPRPEREREPAPSHPAFNPPHLLMPPELPAPQPEPLTNEIMPPSVRSQLEPLLAEIPASAPPMTTQWAYLPLLWINVGFDRSTFILGGSGQWLRSQAGRLLLGASGAAMMAIAAAWLLIDWLGWNR